MATRSRDTVNPDDKLEALSARWNINDEVEGFLHAVIAGKWAVDKVRADIDITDAEASTLRAAAEDDTWALMQIEKIITKRRQTLAVFDTLLARHILLMGVIHDDQSDPARAGVCPGPGSSLLVSAPESASQPGLARTGLLFPELDPVADACIYPVGEWT